MRGEKDELERRLDELRHHNEAAKTAAEEDQSASTKSVELGFAELQSQNETLERELNSLRCEVEEARREATRIEELYKTEGTKSEDLATKLSASEKMVAKLKLKLKQVDFFLISDNYYLVF